MDELEKLIEDPRSAFIIARLTELIKESGDHINSEEDMRKKLVVLYLKFLEKIGKIADSGDLAKLGYRPIVDRQGNRVLSEQDLDELLTNFYFESENGKPNRIRTKSDNE